MSANRRIAIDTARKAFA
jgi:hypothetical protein